MKNKILTLILSFSGLLMFAQTVEKSQRIKYITKAPDGSVAMTIIDDTREDSMKLESANSFYEYQILDPITNKPLLVSKNRGKDCNIDKSKIAAGTYQLKLYTSNFVITSKITVSAIRKLKNSFSGEKNLALNNDE